MRFVPPHSRKCTLVARMFRNNTINEESKEPNAPDVLITKD